MTNLKLATSGSIDWSNFEVANYCFFSGVSSFTWPFLASSLELRTSPPTLSSQPWGSWVSTWSLSWTTSESRCGYLCVCVLSVSVFVCVCICGCLCLPQYSLDWSQFGHCLGSLQSINVRMYSCVCVFLFIVVIAFPIVA